MLSVKAEGKEGATARIGRGRGDDHMSLFSLPTAAHRELLFCCFSSRTFTMFHSVDVPSFIALFSS